MADGGWRGKAEECFWGGTALAPPTPCTMSPLFVCALTQGMDAATAAAAASLVWAVREAVLRDQGGTDAVARTVPPAAASTAGHTDAGAAAGGDSGAGEAGAGAKKKPGRKPGSGLKAKAKDDEEGAEEKGGGGGGEAGGEVVVKKKRGRPPGSGKKKAEGEDGGGGGGGEKKKRKVPRPVSSGSDGSNSDEGSDEDLGSKWKKRKQQGRASEAAAASGKGGGDSAAAAAAASSKSAAGGSVGSPVKAVVAEAERVTEAQVMADLEALRARGDAAALNLAMFGGPVGHRLPGGTAQVLRGVRALAAVAAVGDAEVAASRAALEDGALDAVAAVYLRYRELRYHWSRLYCAP